MIASGGGPLVQLSLALHAMSFTRGRRDLCTV